MKILIVTEFYNKIKGGGEISCRRLAEELTKHGHHVKVWSSENENNFYRLFKLNKEIKNYINKYQSKYDIIHFYGCTIKVKTKTPNITTINNSLLWHPTGHLKKNIIIFFIGWIRMLSMRNQFDKNDRIICVSNNVQKNLTKIGLYNTIVIPSVI